MEQKLVVYYKHSDKWYHDLTYYTNDMSVRSFEKVYEQATQYVKKQLENPKNTCPSFKLQLHKDILIMTKSEGE